MGPFLEVGMVGVNCALNPIPQVPWGGCKESGHGREGGLDGLTQFLLAKTYQINMKVPEDDV